MRRREGAGRHHRLAVLVELNDGELLFESAASQRAGDRVRDRDELGVGLNCEELERLGAIRVQLQARELVLEGGRADRCGGRGAERALRRGGGGGRASSKESSGSPRGDDLQGGVQLGIGRTPRWWCLRTGPMVEAFAPLLGAVRFCLVRKRVWCIDDRR